jgi:hypothetical protein
MLLNFKIWNNLNQVYQKRLIAKIIKKFMENKKMLSITLFIQLIIKRILIPKICDLLIWKLVNDKLYHIIHYQDYLSSTFYYLT